MKPSRPDLHVVPVQLAPGTGLSYDVEELAESLTLSMAMTNPLPQRTGSSYPGALCRWIIRNANRNSGVWIFVLDGFGQPLKSEVTALIQLLAQQIAIPEFARKLRLVLLHFDQPLTGNWRARTIDDGPLIIGGITTQDLIDCLIAFNQRMAAINQGAKMILPAEIPALATAMLERCGGASASQLPSLYDELLAIARM